MNLHTTSATYIFKIVFLFPFEYSKMQKNKDGIPTQAKIEALFVLNVVETRYNLKNKVIRE